MSSSFCMCTVLVFWLRRQLAAGSDFTEGLGQLSCILRVVTAQSTTGHNLVLAAACVLSAVISMQIWPPWSGVLTAVGRSAQAGVVSVVVCWALELCYRRRFVLAGLYGPAAGSGGEGGAIEPVEGASW